MVDINEAIDKNNVILLVLTNETYTASRDKLLDTLMKLGKKLCYITTNKPYKSLTEELQAKSYDPNSVFFVDAISKTVQDVPQVDNCVFVEAPTALTELSMAVSDAYQDKQSDIALIDTISTLSIYQDKNAVVKFVHNLVTKTRVMNKKAILIGLKEDGEEFIKDISMFTDKSLQGIGSEYDDWFSPPSN